MPHLASLLRFSRPSFCSQIAEPFAIPLFLSLTYFLFVCYRTTNTVFHRKRELNEQAEFGQFGIFFLVRFLLLCRRQSFFSAFSWAYEGLEYFQTCHLTLASQDCRLPFVKQNVVTNRKLVNAAHPVVVLGASRKFLSKTLTTEIH